MGCALSKTQDENASEQIQLQLGEVYVFVPGLRFPKRMDFAKFLKGRPSNYLINKLTCLRMRILTAAEEVVMKAKKAPGDSNVADLRKAVEIYLPTLLGLATEDSSVTNAVEFVWTNQEDVVKETMIPSVQYELISVLHLLGILFLLETNSILTPRVPSDGNQAKVTEENKRGSIEILLRAAQVLEFAFRSVLPQTPSDIKTKLPMDVQEGVLKSLALQALAQGVDIQLGLAIDNVKATLAVKRRLACEAVKYWQQASDNLHGAEVGNGWGEKHVLFLKWKSAAAKAAAYYFHGLVLDEGNEEDSHARALACISGANNLAKESEKYCTEFSNTAPATKQAGLWGAMKVLREKIRRDAMTKVVKGIALLPLPSLPDFPLALAAEEFDLPPVDKSWLIETQEQQQQPKFEGVIKVCHQSTDHNNKMGIVA